MSENTFDLDRVSNELHFEISDAGDVNFDNDRYMKMNLSPEQTIHMSALMQQMPTLLAAGAMANSYKLVFPEGVQGTLMQYKSTGGLSNIIRGEDGKIVGHASLFDMKTEAVILGAFTVMSAVTSQYFLAEINSKMEHLNQKLDQIMEFLYGDKKAELLAEIGFVQYAQENYSSIMAHDAQRTATISGLQEARKTAMKDIEFYMGDLSRKVQTSEKIFAKLKDVADTVIRISESLELSKQLFVMGSIMETYFAQNFDKSYVKSVSETAKYYITKCDKRMLGDIRVMRSKLDSLKDNDAVTGYKKKFDSIITSLDGGDDSPVIKSMISVLEMATSRKEYFLNRRGEVYMRAV